jgi:hypothetical protein
MDFRPYQDIEPHLRQKGVLRTDKTLSLFDNSYCSSLYFMDQVGTVFGDNANEASIDKLLNDYGFKYIVVNDSARFNKLYSNNYADKLILTHRGLMVYKIH